jgi:hypothetical protein
MKNKLFMSVLVFLLVVMPVLSFAQISITASTTVCNATVNNLVDILCRIGNLLNKIIPVLLVLGILYFIWGVVQYVIADDEEAKSTGRNRMVWGIIGLVVIVGVWALVRYIANYFGLSNAIDIQVPTVPFGIP